jgi:hypothetical protein
MAVNATDSFAFGEVWYSSDHLKTWFVVLRIVGDQVLVGFECIPAVSGTTAGASDGASTFRPSRALSTEMAGVMAPSP